MSIKRLVLGLLVFLAFPALAVSSNPGAMDQQKQPGWLGVWVGPVPPSLKAQLAPHTPDGEGLMVERVEPQSPAAQAGIAPFDVLLSYNGQKLYNAEQLSSLVYYSPAGTTAEIQVIQQGQVKTLKPQISSAKKRTLAQTYRQPPYPARPPYPQRIPPLQKIPDPAMAWDMFETVEVKTLPDGRYRAKVSFKDQSDEIKTFTFEGKKHEIIEQIEQLKELPDAKKQALLQALNLKPGRLPDLKHFGLDNDFFDHPLFKRNPFDHPFFRDPYYFDRYGSDPWRGSRPAPPWQFHFYPDAPGWNQRQ